MKGLLVGGDPLLSNVLISTYIEYDTTGTPLGWGVWRNSHRNWNQVRKWGSDLKRGSDVWSEKGSI